MAGTPLPVADASGDEIREKALHVHELLCREYGCPIAYFHSFDPLSELISALLSHRTRNKDASDAYKALRERFPTWDAVMNAPTADVQAAIMQVTWPELKAPRIQQVLRRVQEARGGELSLDFLARLDVPAALAWLRTLPGVGPKTAAAVLSFSTLRKPTLPVDAHHQRVAERLRLIPPNTPADRAHVLLVAQLPPDFPPQKMYDNHEALMLHGQRCCYYRNPACERCVVATLCPSCRVPVNAT